MSQPTNLASFGWDDAWRKEFERVPRAAIPARVISARQRMSLVVTEDGEELAWNSLPPAQLRLAVGDWVALSHERYERLGASSQLRGVVAILPRRTRLRRRLVVRNAEDDRVVAANIDLVLVVLPLRPPTRDVSLERYVELASNSGAHVQVVLTKRDLHPAPDAEADRVSAVLGRFEEVVAVSSVTGEGLDRVSVPPRATAVLIGPSGGGKSTLINRIFGIDLQRTRELSRRGTGRHTTTTSQLHRLKNGAMFIDTPGIQNLGHKS